jgi:hypothetical protein
LGLGARLLSELKDVYRQLAFAMCFWTIAHSLPPFARSPPFPSLPRKRLDGPSLEWAKKRDDWPQWLAAIKREIDQLEARGTWRELDQGEDPGRRPLGTKLVLKIKRHPDGSIDKYKARLTVQGFLQRYGVDYMDTTSPVTHTSTVKFLKAHALQMGRKTKGFDFAGAFLYPTLRDDIYMRAPELLGKGKIVLKLLKSLYKMGAALPHSCTAGRATLIRHGLQGRLLQPSR